MLDLGPKYMLAGLNNDPKHSVRVNAKTVLRFKYRIDETCASEAPPTTGPEWNAALKPTIMTWQSRTRVAADQLCTSHTSVGVFRLAVGSYLEALTQNEPYQRIKSRVGQTWNHIMGKIKELIGLVETQVKWKLSSNIWTAMIGTRVVDLSQVV